MARTRVDVGVPACLDHPDSWVIRYGLYGKKGSGRQRQRWRCTPADGSPAHNFAGAVARVVLKEPSACGECDQPLATHQGPAIPARYEFPVLEAALALHRVGAGMSYSEAAKRAALRTERGWASRQLVANWVEVFGPVVCADHAETTWPETIVIDSLPLQAMQPGGRMGVAFTVYGAWGYEAGEPDGRLVALWAAPGDRNHRNWVTFLHSLAGVPTLIVTDQDTATLKGIRMAWGSTPTVRLCRWHLKVGLSATVTPIAAANPNHPLQTASATAFDSLAGWKAFKTIADRVPLDKANRKRLNRWISDRDGYLTVELTRATLRSLPPWEGNGAIEQALVRVKAHMAKRAFCYRNAERTNRLLELVRLHINKDDDVSRYATAIRTHLTTTGRPARQGAIRDRKGIPSLH